MVSATEVFCGPHCETAGEDGAYRSIRTPPGEFDLERLIEALPAAQKPGLVVVQVNRSAQTVARNLHAVDALKVLIAGDTHHLENPISYLLEYAAAERYDMVITESARHHAHYFVEAGLPRVHWLPLLTVNAHPRPADDRPSIPVSFVGSQGEHHPYRRRILDVLERDGVPLEAGPAAQAEAARIHARSLISLNVSLNGDLNLRVLEVLLAGGFLVTDRLSPQSGASLLFEDGVEMVTFDGADDLLATVRHYRAHPDEAERIRARGLVRAEREHAPLVKSRQLLDLVLEGRESDTFSLAHEPRCRRPRTAALDDLIPRLRAYEYVQEEHRKAERLTVVATAGVSGRLLADLADLPRLDLSVDCRDWAERAWRTRALADEGVADRVRLVNGLPSVSDTASPAIAVLAPEDAASLDRMAPPDHVVIEAGRRAMDVEGLGRLTESLARRGLRLHDPLLPAFRRET